MIDSISAGYTLLNRRLWIVLIPVALNLYLVFGAPVSLAPLLQQVRTALAANERALEQASSEPVPRIVDLPESLDHTDMRQPLLLLNFVPVLRAYTLVDGLPAEARAPIDPQQGDVVMVSSGGELFGLLLLFNGAALMVSSFFLIEVATAVRGQLNAGANALLRQVARIAFNIVVWSLVLLIAMVVVAVPLSIVATLLLFIAPQAAILLLVIWGLGIFWVQIYIGFAIEVMALDQLGPLRAIATSFHVVRRNFFPTLGFLALLGIIGLGLGVLWQQISATTAGVLVACVASAYIGSGLAAARMVFYRERLRRTALALRDTRP